jgi:hypothetical protein
MAACEFSFGGKSSGSNGVYSVDGGSSPVSRDTADAPTVTYELKPVENKIPHSQIQIAVTCDDIKELLLQKNLRYGDAALDPIRVFSKALTNEQLCVRIDDKLSRIQRGVGLLGTDEDVLLDLIGYLVLLRISLAKTQN